MQPNDREKASFLKENFVPLLEYNTLKYIDFGQDVVDWIERIKIHFLRTHWSIDGSWIWIWWANLLVHGWFNSFFLSYFFTLCHGLWCQAIVDLERKEFVLNQLVAKNGILILEHDPLQDACAVKVNESKRIVLDEYVGIGQVWNLIVYNTM